MARIDRYQPFSTDIFCRLLPSTVEAHARSRPFDTFNLDIHTLFHLTIVALNKWLGSWKRDESQKT